MVRIFIGNKFPLTSSFEDEKLLWLPRDGSKEPGIAAKLCAPLINPDHDIAQRIISLDAVKSMIEAGESIDFRVDDIKHPLAAGIFAEILKAEQKGNISICGKPIHVMDDITLMIQSANSVSSKTTFTELCEEWFGGRFGTDLHTEKYPHKYAVLKQWGSIPDKMEFPFVLKAPAKAGYGVIIIEDQKQWDEFKPVFSSVFFPQNYELSLEDTLVSPPIIIEPKVEFDESVAASFIVRENNGSMQLEFNNAAIVAEDTRGGRHNGNYSLEIESQLRSNIQCVVEKTAAHLYETGYTGDANVDFLVKNGSIVKIVESNVRVGGSSQNHRILSQDLKELCY